VILVTLRMSKNKLLTAIKNSNYPLLKGHKIAYLDGIHRLAAVKAYNGLKPV